MSMWDPFYHVISEGESGGSELGAGLVGSQCTQCPLGRPLHLSPQSLLSLSSKFQSVKTVPAVVRVTTEAFL